MRSYTTLGSGKSTKVLRVADFHPARTVTTTTAHVAAQLARALVGTERALPAALFDLALSLDGSPVEARRTLLSTFDTVASGAPHSSVPLWEAADALVSKVAAAVVGQPAPVISAVRAEVADHLAELDGVLVPARAVTYGYKRAKLDLVISGPMGWLGDQFWTYLLGPHGQLWVVDDDESFPLGGPLVQANELHDLRMELFDATPVGTDFTDFTMAELEEMSSEDDPPALLVRADHLRAWVAHHRPQDLAALTAALTR